MDQLCNDTYLGLDDLSDSEFDEDDEEDDEEGDYYDESSHDSELDAL